MTTINMRVAFYTLKDGSHYKIINPKLKLKRDGYIVSGILDPLEFSGQEDMNEKLDMLAKTRERLVADLPKIVGKGESNEDIEILSVSCISLNYPMFKVRFKCYDSVVRNYGTLSYIKKPVDSIHSILFSGLSISFSNMTNSKKTRFVFGKPEELSMSGNWDFTETSFSFKYKQKSYDLEVAFIQKENSKDVYMEFSEISKLDLSVYNEIKHQLRAFLSFAAGNTLTILSESYVEDGINYSKLYSVRQKDTKDRSDYIPIGSIHFRRKHILRDYLDSFSNFLLIEKHIDLSNVIFMVNEAKRFAVESGFFILIIALEKLSSEFVKSPLNIGTKAFVIDNDKYGDLSTKVVEIFKEEFKKLKGSDSDGYNILYNKLNNLNKKTKTDKKIDDLLDFTEINKTEDVKRLFPILRNEAIHNGNVNYEGKDAYENYLVLEQLVNEIVSNILQYKGIRFIKQEANKNFCQEKKDYKVDYNTFFEQ